jgi:hypothetical protein
LLLDACGRRQREAGIAGEASSSNVIVLLAERAHFFASANVVDEVAKTALDAHVLEEGFAERVSAISAVAEDAGIATDLVPRVAASAGSSVLVESEAGGVDHNAFPVLVEDGSEGTFEALGPIEGFAVGVLRSVLGLHTDLQVR